MKTNFTGYPLQINLFSLEIKTTEQDIV